MKHVSARNRLHMTAINILSLNSLSLFSPLSKWSLEKEGEKKTQHIMLLRNHKPYHPEDRFGKRQPQTNQISTELYDERFPTRNRETRLPLKQVHFE